MFRFLSGGNIWSDTERATRGDTGGATRAGRRRRGDTGSATRGDTGSATRAGRTLGSATARPPIFPRWPGKARHAGPGRMCGAPRDRGESCALGAHLGGFARGKNKGNYFGPGEAGLAPYRGQSGAFHFSAAGPNFSPLIWQCSVPIPPPPLPGRAGTAPRLKERLWHRADTSLRLAPPLASPRKSHTVHRYTYRVWIPSWVIYGAPRAGRHGRGDTGGATQLGPLYPQGCMLPFSPARG